LISLKNILKMVGIPKQNEQHPTLGDEMKIHFTISGLNVMPRGRMRYRLELQHIGGEAKWITAWDEATLE